ncbi:hypothetical protein JCM18899A_54980 [Nocardioides sp. AN3]
MATDRAQAIVVGGGLAGITAARDLARSEMPPEEVDKPIGRLLFAGGDFAPQFSGLLTGAIESGARGPAC